MANLLARRGLGIVLLAAAGAGSLALLLREDCGLGPGLCLALGMACFLMGLGSALSHLRMTNESRALTEWLRKEGRQSPIHSRARESADRRLQDLRDQRKRTWSFVLMNALAGLLWSGSGALILGLQRF